MNIKILNSWLRDYLKTKATPKALADILSLTSVSVEKIEPYKNDFIFDIEVTTNRPDLMSIIGLAREAGAILPQEGIEAKFVRPEYKKVTNTSKLEIEILNDSSLVNRICAVALEINLKPSPDKIKERVETADIRALNNAVDVTNYVMREVGHPMHVFDYDKLLATGKMVIRLSKKGEKIQTLDNKEYTLPGGDIVADDGTGKIIDLLGVMGTLNSAVDDNTKRVLLFVDNNKHEFIRKTSMELGIRTEAAVLNEKGVDAELSHNAILRGVELLSEIADAKVISEVYDDYPNKSKTKIVSVTEEKINSVMGVVLPIKTSAKILEDLGFEITQNGSTITAKVPSFRANDVEISEDLIEEVARVYGYFKLPSVVPGTIPASITNLSSNIFYWESRARNALKYWGFTELYTIPMVAENMLEVSTDEAVTIKNPLNEENVYMRTTLIPSLLAAARENKKRDELKIFELANVYLKRTGSLPSEKMRLAGILKRKNADFFEVKGIIETLLSDFGIENLKFEQAKSGVGIDIFVDGKNVGDIEQLEEDIIDFELDFETISKNATLKKVYKPVSHFPESREDLRFEIDETIPYEKIVKVIREQSSLIKNVELLDVYKTKKTFRIIYQSYDRNITNEDLTEIREKITNALKKSFKANPA